MMLFSSPPTQHPNLQSKEKPKVVRRRKKRTRDSLGMEAKKRRLSEEQVRFLELNFWKERKLESERKSYLATELGIEPKQVAVWFQNRRARSKNKQLEEEYCKLKNLHDQTVVQKCHLEAEVLHLKEKLLEAEKEIRKLSGVSDGLGGEIGSSSSSTTSFSIDNNQQFIGGEEELVYADGYNTSLNIFEWLDLY